MVNVRKRRAGSDSHGNVWETDGAVVDVEDPAVAAALIALPDGGFELASDEELPADIVSVDDNRPGGTPVHVKAGSEPDSGDVVEVVDPDADTDAEGGQGRAPAPATKTTARKSTSK